MFDNGDLPPIRVEGDGPVFEVWSKDQRKGARWICLGRFTSETAARKFCVEAMGRCRLCDWKLSRSRAPSVRPGAA